MNPTTKIDIFSKSARDNRGLFAAGLVLLIGSSFAALSIPMFIKQAVDLLGVIEAAGDPSPLLRPVFLIIGAAVVQFLLRIFSRMFAFTASHNIIRDARRILFRHIEKLPEHLSAEIETGDLISRATNDLNYVRLLYGFGFLQAINAAVQFIVAFSLMASLDRAMALYAIIPFPFISLAFLSQAGKLQTRSQEVNRSLGRLSAGLEQSLAGASVIKSFTLESVWRNRFDGLNQNLYRANHSLIVARSTIFSFARGAGGLATLMVVYFGGIRVVEGKISLGDLAAFISYAGALAWPTFALGWIVGLFQRGTAAKKRIAEVLALNSMPINWSNRSTPTAPKIEVRDLTFSYSTGHGERKILDSVSFEMAPGEKLGIAGPIGAGKTTLIELMMRLIEPPPGTIFLDGIDITEIEHTEVWSRYSYAAQEPFLFSRSIAENIALGRPGLSREQIEASAADAMIADEIAAFHEGYETVVGERGIKLSGGQRQRVCLAAAGLSEAPVVVLDDNFASVDYRTERNILDGMKNRLAKKSAIIISQRISVLAGTDRIMILEGGKLVDAGTPGELLKRPGFYSRLYRRDRVKSELEAIDG